MNRETQYSTYIVAERRYRGFRENAPPAMGEGIKPNYPTRQEQERVLAKKLAEAGRLVGEKTAQSLEKNKPALILVSGPPASKKSTVVGILRHLLEASGLDVDKVKDGSLADLGVDVNSEKYVLAKSRADAVIWETTINMPPPEKEVDAYIELQGDPVQRMMRLSDKTGSLELAQSTCGTIQKPQRHPERKPDLEINTDAANIRMEHEGEITRWLEEGYSQGVKDTRIKYPSEKSRRFLAEKTKVVEDTGLLMYLSKSQVELLAIRLRQDAIREFPGEVVGFMASRINLILGEKTTQKIPVREFGKEGDETLYLVGGEKTGKTMDAVRRPDEWIASCK